MYIEIGDSKHSTALFVRIQNLLWLVRTHMLPMFFAAAYICLAKILYIVLLVVTSLCLQYNSTVTAYTLRLLTV
jgi:hypothetical protein